jgi:hypothetical protein
MSSPVSLLDKWHMVQTVLRDPDLSPAAKAVAGRLLFHLNATTGRCTPSFETLARGAGMARRTAVRAVRELRASGWVAADRAAGSGSFILAFDRAKDAVETGTEPSLSGDEIVPSTRDETVPLLGTKRSLGIGTKRSPKQGKREQGKGTKSESLDASAFDRFWEAYPRKVGKAAAQPVFERITRDRKATPEELITGAERFAAERAGEDPTFTAHAKTWLNAGRWADEPAPRHAPSRPNGRQSFSAIEALMRNLDHGD